MRTVRTSELLGERVRELRDHRDLSQRGFADLMRTLGVPLHHATVAKVEKGTRKVSIDEIMAFAYALDVAPINLFTPFDEYGDTLKVRVVDREDGDPVDVSPAGLRAWVRGTAPLRGQDGRLYYSTVPGAEWARRRRSTADRLQAAVDDYTAAVADGDRGMATNRLMELERAVDEARRQLGVPDDYPRGGATGPPDDDPSDTETEDQT